jgi:PKD repeat protein/subtilisin-like proprotein convertase family protein
MCTKLIKLTSLIIALFLFGNLQAQQLWSVAKGPQWTSSKNAISPNAEKASFNLDWKAFKKVLKDAPLRFSEASKTQDLVVAFPDATGELQDFVVVEAPTMAAGLSARFPEIKSYAGYQINNPSNYIRFDISPRGLHAMILKGDGHTTLINPVNNFYTEQYEVFYKKDAITNQEFDCETIAPHKSYTSIASEQLTKSALNTEFKTYRLALACTGEYAQFHGGDTTLVLAAMNTTMTRVNGVYEREFALTMEIIDENADVIFLEASNDPYSNNNGGAMLGQNQTTLTANIGGANYDIGHVFSTGGGGIAALSSVCSSNNKARGVTGGGSPVGDPFDIDYVAHEMGHQFGANHTQNNSCNRVNQAAFEPGSASTIMGYAGICNPNVQNNSDDHFHIHSIYEINNHINGGGNCAAIENTSNVAPVISPLNNYSIPHSTPFILAAVATDADTDSLTYCWEQYDNEIANMPPEPTNTNGPAFRSNSPTPDSARFMPRLENVVTNTDNTWEVLASVARSYTFKLSVRDNSPLGGRMDDAEMEVDVIGTAGPFLVNVPNTAVDWPALSVQTIEWDVANTDQAPINSSAVDIYLSIDGGYTYPIAIAENVPNTGSYTGQIPDNQTTTARIMVRGHDNIFYDISNTDFTISIPQEGFLVLAESSSIDVCEGETFNYDLSTLGFAGFDTAITFNLTNQSTEYTYSFATNPVTPGDDNTLSVVSVPDASDNINIWTATIETEAGAYTGSLDIEANIYPLTVGATTLSSPLDADTQVNPQTTFSWEAVNNASAYQLEISTEPDFSANNTVLTNITETTYTLGDVLETETTYYWRVTAFNPCATGSTSATFSFETSALNCANFAPADLPVLIDPGSVNTVSSTLTLPIDGPITDINVTGVEIQHTWINDIQLTLVSPAGTAVKILDSTCSQENDLSLSFDDDAPNNYGDWPCPPTDGLTYTPFESLAAFNGENAGGTWTLLVDDIYDQDGGSLDAWNIDVCYLGAPPLLLSYDVIDVNCFGESNGAILLTASSGTGNYEYLWENGNTTNSLVGVSAGDYTVTLSDGNTEIVETITVNQPDAGNIAGTTTPDFDGQSNGSISLNISGGVEPYDVEWEDGPTTTDRSDLAAGLYIVTVTDANGCIFQAEFAIAAASTPVAAVDSDVASGCVPLVVQFNNQSTNATTYAWTFEGGTPATSSEENPVVTYNEAGNYQVILVASNDFAADTFDLDDFIITDEGPTSLFESENGGNGIYNFTNNSQNATSYNWDFDNGSTSTEENPSSTFDYPGTYNIQLIATNDCGSDTSYFELITTSVNALSEDYKLSILPNPNDGSFILNWDLPTAADDLHWTLSNTLGQQVDQGIVKELPLIGYLPFEYPNLASGVYFLDLQIAGKYRTFRLVID